MDNAFEISEDFEKKAARNYLPSEVKNVNFAGDPTSAENKINRWTRNQTKGKITKLFDSGNYTTLQQRKKLSCGQLKALYNWKNSRQLAFVHNTTIILLCLYRYHRIGHRVSSGVSRPFQKRMGKGVHGIQKGKFLSFC